MPHNSHRSRGNGNKNVLLLTRLNLLLCFLTDFNSNEQKRRLLHHFLEQKIEMFNVCTCANNYEGTSQSFPSLSSGTFLIHVKSVIQKLNLKCSLKTLIIIILENGRALWNFYFSINVAHFWILSTHSTNKALQLKFLNLDSFLFKEREKLCY